MSERFVKLTALHELSTSKLMRVKTEKYDTLQNAATQIIDVLDSGKATSHFENTKD